MLVLRKRTDDPSVHELPGRRGRRVADALTRRILKLRRAGFPAVESLNTFPTGALPSLEALAPDVVHLHWVGGNMLSVGEIGRLRFPVVWTLHDMWAFSGIDHYEHPTNPARFAVGYARSSRPADERGVDLDRLAFLYKMARWRGRQFHFVAPSRWLAECGRRSTLGRGHAVDVIPNCIDTTVFRPRDRSLAGAR